MSEKIKALLEGKGGNYIFPFFWQHGESEEVLRKYMEVIDESNIKAVCVESRPHPDFCGPKWWEDMDIILDEARKREMKVWILDDSHFPTGFANGAMKDQPDERCRQGICCQTHHTEGGTILKLTAAELAHPKEWEATELEQFIGEKNPRKFEDDRLLGICAVNRETAQKIDLAPFLKEDCLEWEAPAGEWKVYILHLSRNTGYHRSYINMMDQASCKVLLDAVYEPHYAKYKNDFGTTIAGFFSDEPELGNGHLYEMGKTFGEYEDLPWSAELEAEIKNTLGSNFICELPLLWEQEADLEARARVRYAYMDAVSRLVERDFSRQLGEWCRTHGVKYIGHLIEDNNQHARTGSSLGHYFRGLAGQDMAGIDVIGGQVMPGEEEVNIEGVPFKSKTGEFFHYMLGKLGSSAAAIEPLKKGDSMCEIFGAYGWECGVRLQKYLTDHFLVRGINHFVPHAFSAKEFPDPDCPPHFYAHGHNPQYRHFGALMAYMNRMCGLISGGRHIAPAAVLYHGEGEWTGEVMFSHRPAHLLADAQIEYDYIPQDVFAQPGEFQTQIKEKYLKVNTQEYKVVIVPYMQFVTKAFAEAVGEMTEAGIPVLFIEKFPEGICDWETTPELMEPFGKCETVGLDQLVSRLYEMNTNEISLVPSNDRVRYLHYEHTDGTAVYMFVNEGEQDYSGKISLEDNRSCYVYDVWNNRIEPAQYRDGALEVEISPLKSLVVIFDPDKKTTCQQPVTTEGERVEMNHNWRRSICKSIAYPEFEQEKEITLPDCLTEEEPKFSGFVRYENMFAAAAEQQAVLEITDAHEGVEVFVNGQSLGIQIAPPFVYDLSAELNDGKNEIVIEVATTLEREMADIPDFMGQIKEAESYSGITGDIRLYIK